MKMKLMATMGTLLVAQLASAHDLPRGKVAELGLHRLERLAILKKVDASFQVNAFSMKITVLTPAQDTDPKYQVDISQGPAADATQKTLTLLADDEAKFVSFSTNTASEPASAPKYPQKDAVGFLEVALHCVQGEQVESSTVCTDMAALAPFNTGFKSVSLQPTVDAQGAIIGAQAEILADGADSKVIVSIKNDGTLADANPVQIVKIQ
ncbi:MAG: hypothetical protein H7222_00575 [Methylotenera sp.]|nr:hypothetical protein [Oligoflexia bacterium]